jgi:phosphoribosylformylglycinamidine cyclo-ligase
MADESVTYESAGVNLDKGKRAVTMIQEVVRSTQNPAVLGESGGFGGMFLARFEGMQEPVLVSSIDGVGTKTAVATMVGSFHGLGVDIVNHCINDILVHGASPLFFLDYFASSTLNAEILLEIVKGAAEACREAGCVILGGETAEMPGVYCDGEMDIVGTIVGVVDRERILPLRVGPGDLIVGLASNGLHTNGFSLARKALFEVGGHKPDEVLPELGRTLGEELLRPHRSYLNALTPLLEEGGMIHALAHITGGGIIENLPRVLGADFGAVIERRAWVPHPIFGLIQQSGRVSDEEMFKAFNMGLGMLLICPSESASAVVQRLNDADEAAYVVGEVLRGPNEVSIT